ncbi:hypothetical protein NCCP2716_27450 [Sporosarcina sp. NCCP-2716]|nr:hypothetical protein [Sporosarcina sp. NCCP-2716]GKV70247.1 hypothetical protein NCCP2716_27450 [Sporosarcina sp. NCCP-2716]
MSRETEKQIIIAELNRLGIFETTQKRPLQEQSYYSLRSMLAQERAVRS